MKGEILFLNFIFYDIPIFTTENGLLGYSRLQPKPELHKYSKQYKIVADFLPVTL